MKTIFSIILLLSMSFSIKANGNEAELLLNKYGLKIDSVLNIIDISHPTYSYNSRISNTIHTESNDADTETAKSYSYDASKNIGEQFTLLTVDGASPSKKDIKNFNKEKNKNSNQKKALLKSEDFFIISNDENTAIIGFNMPKEELPSKLAYLAHCTGSIFIDKKTGRITKFEIKSKEPFSMKIFHVNNMFIEINLSYSEELKRYYVIKETAKMEMMIMGVIATSVSIEVFSDFKFN